MRWLAVLGLLFVAALQADEDPHLLLKKIGQIAANTINRSDNYICTQDLSRFYYLSRKTSLACQQPPAAPAVPASMQDRLKLDVAVSEGNEIYSWHGDHKFGGNRVRDIVREGPISSGGFNGYLRNIFVEQGVKFFYRGRSTVDGSDFYQFNYKVPLASSHYRIEVEKESVAIPFHGSFSARADNLQLYSLTVTADGDQMPPKSNICSAETRLTYQPVKIGHSESLLPASFDLLMESRRGLFTDSKGKYSGCREYTGESTVHFDMDDPATEANAPPTLQSEPLKAGLFLPIVLRGEIDEDSAYAGLPVQAVLGHDVKLAKGIKLSRGAALNGAVTSFQIFNEVPHRVDLRIEFSSITDGKKLYLCTAVHDIAPVFQQPSVGNRGRGRGMMPSLPMDGSDELVQGTITFRTPHLHLDNSFTSLFVTVAPEPDAQ